MNEERKQKARERYERTKDPKILQRKIEKLIETAEDRLMFDQVELWDSILTFREIEGNLDKMFDSHPIYISSVFS
jgi:hypothetical protein